MTYYTYRYNDPKTDIPVYIGKGKNKRAWTHFKKKSRLGSMLSKRLSEGYVIQPVIAYHKDELTALAMERFWIAVYGREDLGRGTLFNLTDGGESGSGYVPTEKDRENLRIKNTGKKHPRKPFSEEEKRIHRINSDKRFGTKATEETKRKMSETHQYTSEETRKKLSESTSAIWAKRKADKALTFLKD